MCPITPDTVYVLYEPPQEPAVSNTLLSLGPPGQYLPSYLLKLNSTNFSQVKLMTLLCNLTSSIHNFLIPPEYILLLFVYWCISFYWAISFWGSESVC